MNYSLKTYQNATIQAEELAEQIAQSLQDCLNQKGKATLVVPGGSTPVAFLQHLSRQDIDWSKIIVLLSDERWVSVDNARSNYGLLCRTLKKNNALSAHFPPYYSSDHPPLQALPKIEGTLRTYLPVDVCVLGMGEDMHTASLFPNANGLTDAITENSGRIVALIRPDQSSEMRLSLSGDVLRKAQQHHVLIKGNNKLKALKQAENTALITDAPIRLILEQPHVTVHYTETE